MIKICCICDKPIETCRIPPIKGVKLDDDTCYDCNMINYTWKVDSVVPSGFWKDNSPPLFEDCGDPVDGQMFLF